MSERGGGQEALERAPLIRLLPGFCIPALLSSLVTSVYNIVDQLFIGNKVGLLGNAAANVVYPAVTVLTALSLMCGVGTSAVMNLSLGNGEREKARMAVGNGVTLMVLCGAVPCIAILLFTEPLLYLFGCTDAVLPYAFPYARITALGYIFSMLGAAGPFLIRADGSPRLALVCTAAGAVLNVFLDALFVYGFEWGIEGAAWATVIGQAVSAGIFVWYLLHFKSFPLFSDPAALSKKAERQEVSPVSKLQSQAESRSGRRECAFMPVPALTGRIIALGAGPMFNFLSQALVQILMNGALKTYGAQSIYGSETTLAVAGVANKVNTLAVAVFTGLANGMQPIVSYNFGRKNYKRVIRTGQAVIGSVLAVSFLIFLCYQFFPRQITACFGSGDELYYEFAERYFRIFLMLIFLNGLLNSVGGFFSAQGKPWQSIALSFTRQIVMLPLLLSMLPRVMGLDGVLWSGPIADLVMACLAGVLFIRRIRELEQTEK